MTQYGLICRKCGRAILLNRGTIPVACRWCKAIYDDRDLQKIADRLAQQTLNLDAADLAEVNAVKEWWDA